MASPMESDKILIVKKKCSSEAQKVVKQQYNSKYYIKNKERIRGYFIERKTLYNNIRRMITSDNFRVNVRTEGTQRMYTIEFTQDTVDEEISFDMTLPKLAEIKEK